MNKAVFIPFLVLLSSFFLTGCNISSSQKSAMITGDTIIISLAEGEDLYLQNYACIAMMQPVLFYEEGKDYFMGYNPKLHALDIFNVTDKVTYQQIPLQKEGPDGIIHPMGIARYKEGFLITTIRGVQQINRQGKVIASVPAPDLTQWYAKGYSINKSQTQMKLCNYNFLFFAPETGTLATVLYPPETNISTVTEPVVVVLQSVETGTIEWVEIPFPDYFSSRKNWDILCDLNVCMHEEKVVMNFGGSSDVFIYRRDTKELVKHTIPSQFLPPLIIPKEDDGSEMSDAIYAGYYYPLQYDPVRKVYWRLAIDAGIRAFDFNRPFYLTKISTDFSRFEEVKLPEGLNLYPYVLAGKEGVYFSYTVSDSEEEFRLFRVNL